jgi:cytochrome P450
VSKANLTGTAQGSMSIAYLPPLNVYTFVGSLLLGTYLVNSFIRYLAQRRFSKLHGCQPPVREGSAYRIGISRARELARQFKNQTFLDFFAKQFRQHGNTFVSRVAGMDIIFTCDPQNLKQVLHKQFDDYEYGPLRAHLFAPITPKGLLRFDGHLWKPGRKMFRVDFKDSRAITDMDNLESKTQKLIDRLVSSGGSADLQDLFTRVLTDIMSTFAVGKSLNTLDRDQNEEDKAVAEALETTKGSIAKFGLVGPLGRFYDQRPFKQAIRTIHQYVQPFVKNAFDAHYRGGAIAEWKQSAPQSTFVDRVVPTSEDELYLRDQTINVFLAGIDTGAELLSAAFFLMSRDHRVFHKLREAILEHVGQRIPTYEEANNIPYLRYVLYEGKM